MPLMILRALADERLPVYGDGQNIRDWIHVIDHCAAVFTVLMEGRSGQIYNIGADNEWRNIDLVKAILSHLGKPESLIQFVKDRPGHDRRYAIDSTKLRRETGWHPLQDFDEGLQRTINWYRDNESWWREVLRKGRNETGK